MAITWDTRLQLLNSTNLIIRGFLDGFTLYYILLDLELRGFELRGVSKVHLAAYLEALLYNAVGSLYVSENNVKHIFHLILFINKHVGGISLLNKSPIPFANAFSDQFVK